MVAQANSSLRKAVADGERALRAAGGSAAPGVVFSEGAAKRLQNSLRTKCVPAQPAPTCIGAFARRSTDVCKLCVCWSRREGLEGRLAALHKRAAHLTSLTTPPIAPPATATAADAP